MSSREEKSHKRSEFLYKMMNYRI